MFDTMTFTKTLGAFCGALLLFLFAKWGADSLYAVGGGHGAHGEEHVAGYVIEVEDSGEAEVEEEGPDFATLMASADVASGAKVFKKCAACHKVEEGANATGPYLYGVVGRPIDAVEGFGYSEALLQVGDTWTPEALFTFLESPRKAAPGTSMSFAGLKKETDRVDLIAYLDSLDD
ncbi:c-type cytochrome [Lentibacter sp. XHP0401]|jgi:cytochrome c|uniref:c-type cytochrome n=1 Tax=Lentibacter sp. XHP0401 TaxID=2984334 RepID=UPI0021E9A765|nr:cytochrome c family protein [Lentibacter sp. XHP0401]MCV2893806.1 cytochrome c family protein [Lentibacter sp. XHP0401]